MRETFTSGSVGGAPGNRCFYPEDGHPTTRVYVGWCSRQTPWPRVWVPLMRGVMVLEKVGRCSIALAALFWEACRLFRCALDLSRIECIGCGRSVAPAGLKLDNMRMGHSDGSILLRARSSHLITRAWIAFMAVILCVSSGCYMTIRDWKAPFGTGRVVDAISGEPIKDARVMFKGYPESSTATDDRGSFTILVYTPKRVRAGVWDDFPPWGTLIVEAPGYQTMETDDPTLQRGKRHIELQREK